MVDEWIDTTDAYVNALASATLFSVGLGLDDQGFVKIMDYELFKSKLIEHINEYFIKE